MAPPPSTYGRCGTMARQPWRGGGIWRRSMNHFSPFFFGRGRAPRKGGTGFTTAHFTQTDRALLSLFVAEGGKSPSVVAAT